jgi:hypothetical protein
MKAMLSETGSTDGVQDEDQPNAPEDQRKAPKLSKRHRLIIGGDRSSSGEEESQRRKGHARTAAVGGTGHPRSSVGGSGGRTGSPGSRSEAAELRTHGPRQRRLPTRAELLEQPEQLGPLLQLGEPSKAIRRTFIGAALVIAGVAAFIEAQSNHPVAGTPRAAGHAKKAGTNAATARRALLP